MNEESFTSSGTTTAGTYPGAPHLSESPLEHKAGETTQSFQTEAQRLRASAREQGTAAVDQVKSGVRAASAQVREAGTTFVRTQQQSLASRCEEYAQAARKASGQLGGVVGSEMLSAPAARVADGLEQVSDYLKTREPIELLGDLESFARRRPEIVLGGLFVVGLAAARFLKASRRSLDERQRARMMGSFEGTGAPYAPDLGASAGVAPVSTMPSSGSFGSESIGTGSSFSSSPSTSAPLSSPGVGSSPSVSPLTGGAPSSSGASDCGCSTVPGSSNPTNTMP